MKSVNLTDTGVAAELSLDSGIKIPADLEAEVHSQSAVGEQYVTLLPRSGDGPGVEGRRRDPAGSHQRSRPTSTRFGRHQPRPRGDPARQPEDGRRRGLYRGRRARAGAVAGWFRERTALAIDARKNLDPLTTLIDQSKPVLDTQTDTAGSIQAWASNLATITDQLQTQDPAVAGILDKGPGAADEVRALFDRLQPTLPIVLANLVSIGEVAVDLPAEPRAVAGAAAPGHRRHAGSRRGQAEHQTGLRGRLRLNLNLQSLVAGTDTAAAAAVPPPAPPASCLPSSSGSPASRTIPTAGGRPLLPRPAGRAVQRARRPQPAVRNRARQTRSRR